MKNDIKLWPTTKTIEKKCIHHGLTLFYAYEKPICVKCAHLYKRKYFKENRQAIQKYARLYVRKNKKIIAQKLRIKRLAEQKKKLIERRDIFNYNKKLALQNIKNIKKIFQHFQLEVDIDSLLLSIKIRLDKRTLLKTAYEYCYKIFKAALVRKIMWQESTKVKYKLKLLKATNNTTISFYKKASEKTKEKVRMLTNINTNKIVNKILKEKILSLKTL